MWRLRRGSAKSVSWAGPAAMASRGPDRVAGPPLWLPACKVTLSPSPGQRVPAVSLPATRARWSPDRIVSPAASAQVRALGDDFADPLGAYGVSCPAHPGRHAGSRARDDA